MEKYIFYIPFVLTAILYTFFTQKLLFLNQVFLKETHDINNIPEKVIVYTTEKNEKTFTNVDDDIEEIIKDLDKKQKISIPRHGVYMFTVNIEGDKKTILGIPN